ncbi:hypothetical protein AYI75_14150 [Shewanella algae]|uniref:Nramp family divalent metal transporter n=1 Tax=Shewanella algae TaxID=38313 RepID=UPI00119ED6D8|nr:hypothetical protein AYI75_14150 [Shewanella algae]
MNDTILNRKGFSFTHLRHLMAAMGPGVLVAAAAIGASHLVASTRAGAEFGWQLAWLVVLVNLLKYPFFAAGARYTAATGESLLEGYLKQGKGYLWLFSLLNLVAAIASTAGVSMLSAAMLTQFVPLGIDILSFIVLCASLLLLLLGRYSLLDRMTKVVMALLTLGTLTAAAMMLGVESVLDKDFVSPSPWQWAYLGFLIAMMGWMPAPIEVSAWNSLWLLEKQRINQQQAALSAAQARLDFDIGYWLTALLALVFLSLGAGVMHGSGASFADSGAQFAGQLISLYASVLGEWSRMLIALVALLCIFSTTVTVLDGYSRTLDAGWRLLLERRPSGKRLAGIMLVMSLLALLLILFFKGALLSLLELVMIQAFMTTCIFAWLNLRLMSSKTLPTEARYGRGMQLWGWLGLGYLFGFALLFIYWYCYIK